MRTTPNIVIVGGGFCGAAAAWHLAQRLTPGQARIIVVEPRATLGAGLAYSTVDPAHRINVPAARMTLRTDTPADFTRWLAAGDTPDPDPDSLGAGDALFPQRALFGAYVADRLRPMLAASTVTHRQARALRADVLPGGYALQLSDGETIEASVLVIATTHPPPALPAALASLTGSHRLIADPYAAGALDRVGRDEAVMIVGTGLTSADMIASLDLRGHGGTIVALSRHGYRSMPHGPAQAATSGDFATGPARSARQVLARIRAAVARDAQGGLTWHAALDLVRAQGPAIWAALDLTERDRLVRHLRALWDVHRFRIAPQVAEVIARRQAAGTLGYRAGRLLSVMEDAGGIGVTWRPRGSALTEVLQVERLIVTTGPAHGAVMKANPLLASLAAAGLVQADALGLGLAVDARARAIGSGRPGPAPILICGPLARATVGELMGVPEVTAHAELVAAELVDWVTGRHAPARQAG